MSNTKFQFSKKGRYVEKSKNSITYLKQKEGFLSKILENEQLLIVVWTLDNAVIWFNNYTQTVIDILVEEQTERIDVSLIIPQDIINYVKEHMDDTEGKSIRFKAEKPMVMKNGTEIYIMWHNSIICDDEDNKYVVSTGIDITDLKSVEKRLEEANRNLLALNEELVDQREELIAMNEELMAQEEELRQNLLKIQSQQDELKKSGERYKLVVEGASDGLWDWDLLTDTAYISERWRDVIGLDKEEVNNYLETWTKCIHPEDIKTVIHNLQGHLEKKMPFFSCEYRVRTKNGRYMWISSRGKALWDEEGKAIRLAGSHTDISERKQMESKLEYMAFFDPLTNLPRRDVFMEKLKATMADASRNGKKLAVFFIDLDNFKTINDSLGHLAGDKLLKKISKQLKACVRETDTVSRVGGDEFLILLPDIRSTEDTDRILERILELCKQPIKLSNHELCASMSIGIAIYPDHGKSERAILKNADIAMYKAKEKGKNGYHYYDSTMASDAELAKIIKKI